MHLRIIKIKTVTEQTHVQGYSVFKDYYTYSFVSIISSDIACQSIIYPSPPKLLSLTHYIH